MMRSRKITFYGHLLHELLQVYNIHAIRTRTPHMSTYYNKTYLDAMHAQDEGRVPGGLDGEWCP